MLIEQIIEFQLKLPAGPFGGTCISIVDCFHDKIKISKENLPLDYYLQLKYFRRNVSYFALPGQNH